LDFDERTAWEIENKGWCGLVEIHLHDGEVAPISFWDDVRLLQEIAAQFAKGESFFAEPNMIVLPKLTGSNMRAALTALHAEGYFKRTKPAI